MSEARAAWMFKDWPEDSLAHAGQRLALAVTRLLVVALYRPLRPVVRWLRRRLPDE